MACTCSWGGAMDGCASLIRSPICFAFAAWRRRANTRTRGGAIAWASHVWAQGRDLAQIAAAESGGHGATSAARIAPAE
jgi:hypothetical protein